MSVAERKLVYVNGTLIQTEEGATNVVEGGLEGEPVMSSSGFSGTSRKPTPGKVTTKVVINSATDRSIWNSSAFFDVVVEYPDLGSAHVFSGMQQMKVFAVDGKTAECELCGPQGEYVEG